MPMASTTYPLGACGRPVGRLHLGGRHGRESPAEFPLPGGPIRMGSAPRRRASWARRPLGRTLRPAAGRRAGSGEWPGGIGRFPAREMAAGRAGGAAEIVGIERHQRSRLIRGEFLPDLACGFRQIGCAFERLLIPGFNTCVVLPGYHTTRRRCKSCATRHIPSCAQTTN